MSKNIYRVYDIYCTGDSFLHTTDKVKAEAFCKALNKKSPVFMYKVEEVLLETPHWKEDWDCMPGGK